MYHFRIQIALAHQMEVNPIRINHIAELSIPLYSLVCFQTHKALSAPSEPIEISSGPPYR
jgi:hypothetical protein